ncbi:hypothetical protein NFI96_029536, partial [Prochilodus magdalenae]
MTSQKFVKCSTRGNRTLDLLYANVKAAYNSKALPPLGRSDHNLVVLTPQYKPLVQRQPASIRSVRKWSPEAVESLQGCFEATQWDVLCDPHNQDIDEVTSCVTDYINFCVDSVVPSKTIRCFANNKPWVTSNLKHLLNQKKRAFKTGDKEELKRVQTELRIRIKEAKEEYRTKLETKLENNNIRDVFLRFDNDSPTTTLSSAGSPVVLNLNTSPEQQPPPFTAHTSSIPNIYTSSDSNGPFTTPAQDQSSSSAPTKELKKLKQGKAAGADGIQPKVLKLCAEQLCGILQHIFNLSCSQERVPVRWKPSCVVPVPKKKHPVELNQNTIGVDDAVIYLMDKVHSHLDIAGSAVRIMFFDFSSAFNTLQPVLLGDKLRQMQLDESIISWTMDYLTGRPQFVRMQGCVSDVAMCSTGAPQGTVLAPFLFNIYTSDFRYNSGTCHLQKFSDDTAIVGKNRSPQAPVTIDGEEVEVVGTYKYLGVHLDNKLDWSSNTSAVFKRGQSRLYFLRKLRSFGVCTKLLWTFYQSVVASAIFYSVVCWGNSINKTAINKLNKLVKKAGSVIGLKLDTLEVVAEKRTLNKLLAVMNNAFHPLHCAVEKQRSTFSGRLRQLRCAKERRVRSFLPTAIRLYNESPYSRNTTDPT